MNGTKISRRELRARWAYIELSCKRFAHDKVKFNGPDTESLFLKAKQGLPIEALTDEEIEQLLNLNESCFRSVPAALIDESIGDVDQFVLEDWCKEQVLDTSVTPSLGGGAFVDYVIRETTPGLSSDVRTACARQGNVKFVPEYPICVVPFRGRQMILEGVLRALMFIADKDPKLTIQVWVPVMNGN